MKFTLLIFFLATMEAKVTSVNFDSIAGDKLLRSPDTHVDSFYSLLQAMETQETQAFCGIASMTMALNSLEFPPETISKMVPIDSVFNPYPFFTQNDVFNLPCIKSGVFNISESGAFIFKGASLDQLHDSLGCFHAEVTTESFFYDDLPDVEKFSKLLVQQYVSGKKIIANIDRSPLYGLGGGHFSPLGAIRKTKHQKFQDAWVLFLDVSRYKYQPRWFHLGDLVKSMANKEGDGKSRGFLAVSKKVN